MGEIVECTRQIVHCCGIDKEFGMLVGVKFQTVDKSLAGAEIIDGCRQMHQRVIVCCDIDPVEAYI